MIGSYTSVLRRRARVIALLTVLLALAAFLLLTAGGRNYHSTAVIQTGSNLAARVVGLDTPYEPTESRLATEVEFFSSDMVAERAQRALAAQGWTETAQELSERVSVSPRGVSPLLDVVGTASTPERAEQLTNAFVEAYVTQRRESQRESLQAVVSDLLAEQEDAEAELNALDEPFGQAPAVQRDRAAAQSWYDTVTDRIEQARLRLSVDTSGVSVLAAAAPAEVEEGLTTRTAVPVALVAGLLGACGLVLLLDLLRDPVRTRDEAQKLLSAPMLGEVPTGRRDQPGTVAAVTDPSSPVATGARGVRLRLERLLQGATPRTLVMVATPTDVSEATLVAAALASTWSRTGSRVAVVFDAGTSARTTVEALETLEDEVVPVGANLRAHATRTPGVWVVPATRGADGEAGFLEQTSPAAALAQLHEAFDVVLLVDSRSAALDAAAIGHLADATVAVCALGRTPAGRLQRLGQTLGDYGAQIDGVVLTSPASQHRPGAPLEKVGETDSRPQTQQPVAG
ncbi:subunit length determinant protein [Kineococcus xinjiangensis]|uniref:Subunit length determinant protein n=1 Tax=Kineococcus xinjiangensis TaxID=512762 RepID=A0A2S6ISL2_9ACTN|nr:hypothetical protein [Kineococcus xinjiangensis]PPK97237.1 subunit length determinant protein [Kineococcus xinjiangensis]